MRDTLTKLIFYKGSIRAKLSKTIAKRFGLFPYETRIEHSAIDRPHYGYCVLRAAQLAKRLGHNKVSVIEFGVAGGNGLLSLERHAAEVKKLVDLKIQIFGFDTGHGLPPPADYRDLPHHWKQGFFAMDIDKLRARLSGSTLVIGDIANTLPTFAREHDPAPIGAIFMDLDYYSSTKDAFKLFEMHRSSLLPRVFLYFDDIVGDDIALFSEHTGVLLAINEFNDTHDSQKICKTSYLGTRPYPETWHHQIFIYHDFGSNDYCRFVSEESQQLPLTNVNSGQRTAGVAVRN
jgi:hypothetical protein